MNTTIAFFDVDGTVVRGRMATQAIRYLIARRELTHVHLVRGAFYATLHYVNLMNYEAVFRQTVAAFVGTREERIIWMARDCFERHVQDRIYSDAAERIRHHESAGDRVVLISSAPRYLVEALADHFGLKHAIGTGARVERERITDQVEGELCYGEGKLLVAEAYARKCGAHLQDCHFYSDSVSDLPLLRAVGHPWVVNPDIFLRRVAHRMEWRVLSFR